VEVNSAYGWVDIAVTDHGVGIDSAELGRIFERFYRVEPASATTVTGGTGLGLAIVRFVARVHGGSASALSVLGEGSRVTMRLPRPPDSA
jgi:two-component system sensor histidine kinase SenX3